MAIIYLTQSAGSYVAYGLSTDTKPTPTSSSLFIETDTGNNYTGNGSSWIITNNRKMIRSLSDFPTPVSSVITLENNTTYIISGTVDIGTNRIAVGIKNTITGFDRQNDILISSTLGNMFTMDNSVTSKGTLIFDNLTLRATAGTLISATGGTTEQVTFITTTVSQTLTGGTFSGISLSIRTSSLSSAFSTNGFTFTGTNSLTLRDSTVIGNVGTLFNMASSTMQAVRISRNYINTATGRTFIDGTSSTITIASEIANNTFEGVGTQFAGVTTSTTKWYFTDNIGVTNTPILNSSLENTSVANLSGTNTGDNATNTQYSGLAASKQDVNAKLTSISALANAVGYLKNNGSGVFTYDTPAGGGDVSGPIISVDNQIALFSGVTGKILKADTSSGILKSTAGVLGTATAGTDYLAPNGNGSALTGLTKSQVGLGNVDNTSDVNKPVSTATQTALDGKQPLDANLTTIAGLTATTDNVIQSVSGAWASRTPAQLKTSLALVKADVGLSNVDNTSDAGKPVSTAQQTALDLKAPLASPTFTGTPTLPTGTIATTQTAGNNTTAIATTAFVTAINNNASYRTILQAAGSHTAARVAGTYGMGMGDPIAISGTGTLYPLSVIQIVAADYPTINGITTKLRIRAQLYTNDVAPTGNYTFGLYPITRPATSGGAGLAIYTLGTVVTGSNGATFTAPAADLLGSAVSADFALPADGAYVIGIVTTATVAASSHVHVNAQLQLRNT